MEIKKKSFVAFFRYIPKKNSRKNEVCHNSPEFGVRFNQMNHPTATILSTNHYFWVH